MPLNMSYSLRWPQDDEIRATFGTLRAAVRATGGYLPLLCYYLANPAHIPTLGSVMEPVSPRDSTQARELRERADIEEVAEAWDAMERKSITATAKATGHGFPYCKRALLASGRLKVSKVSGAPRASDAVRIEA